MTGRLSIVFTQKVVADETFIKVSSKIRKSIVGVDSSQRSPFQYFMMCQQDFTRDASLTLICRNSRVDIIELANLKIWSCLFASKQDQNVKLRFFHFW